MKTETLNDKIEELKKIKESIPEKYRNLKLTRENQEMRLVASINAYEECERKFKEAIKKLKEEPEDFQYKVVNYEPKDLDAWGKKIKYPKKYSWKDIEFAIKLKLEQIDKLSEEFIHKDIHSNSPHSVKGKPSKELREDSSKDTPEGKGAHYSISSGAHGSDNKGCTNFIKELKERIFKAWQKNEWSYQLIKDEIDKLAKKYGCDNQNCTNSQIIEKVLKMKYYPKVDRLTDEQKKYVLWMFKKALSLKNEKEI